MAAAARARHAAAEPRRREQPEPSRTPPVARRATISRRRAAQRARLTRAFVFFFICLTVLAIGRVALSFAVVQKTLQTDAVVREERAVSSENERLAENLAQLSSTVRIRHIAQAQLGLVDADHVLYLRVPGGVHDTAVAERP